MAEQPAATTSTGRTLRPKKPNLRYSDGSDDIDIEGKPAVAAGASPAQAAPKPSQPKKKRQFLTDQLWSDNPEERGRERNRIHARKSRQRKKVYIDGLKAENAARTAELELLISTWEQAYPGPDASFVRSVPDPLNPAMCAQLNALSDSDMEDASPSRKGSQGGYDDEAGGGSDGGGEDGSTLEARQARARERNRIHARKSRMRKKLFTEQCAKIHGAIMKDIERCRKEIAAAFGESAPVLSEASAKYESVLEEQLAYWQQVSMGMAEDNEKRQDKLAAAALVPDAVGPRAKRGRPSLYDGSGGGGEDGGSGGEWEEDEEEDEEEEGQGAAGLMPGRGEGDHSAQGGTGAPPASRVPPSGDPLAMLVEVEGARAGVRGRQGTARGLQVRAGEDAEGQGSADMDGQQSYGTGAGNSYRPSSTRGGRGGAASVGRKRGRTADREGEGEGEGGGRGDGSRSSSGRSRSSSAMEGYSEGYEDGEDGSYGEGEGYEEGGDGGRKVSSSGRRIRPVRQADDGYDVDTEQPLGRRKRKQHPVGYPGRGRPRKTYPGGGHGHGHGHGQGHGGQGAYMGQGLEGGVDGAGSVDGSSGGGSHGSGSGGTPAWSLAGSSDRAHGASSSSGGGGSGGGGGGGLPSGSPMGGTGSTGTGEGGDAGSTSVLSTGVHHASHGHGAPSVRSASTYGSSHTLGSSSEEGRGGGGGGAHTHREVIIVSLPALAKQATAAPEPSLAHRLYVQAMELLRHGKASEGGRAIVPPVTGVTGGGEGGHPLLVIPARLPPHPCTYVKLAVAEGDGGSLCLTYDSPSYRAALGEYGRYYTSTLLPALEAAYGKEGVKGAGQPLAYTTEYYKEAEEAVKSAMEKVASQPSSAHAEVFAQLPLVHPHPLQALHQTYWEQGKREAQDALAKCIVQPPS